MGSVVLNALNKNDFGGIRCGSSVCECMRALTVTARALLSEYFIVAYTVYYWNEKLPTQIQERIQFVMQFKWKTSSVVSHLRRRAK